MCYIMMKFMTLTLICASNITSARWVGGGHLDLVGMGRVAATTLFPGAPKSLFFCLNFDLAAFEWPMNGSNYSCYRDVPRDLAVVVYRKGEDGKEVVVDWETAEKEGCAKFAVRAVVSPGSTKEGFVQIGVVPFDIEHMLTNYAQVYQEAWMPNTMVRVTRVPTKLLPGGKVKESRLVQRVQLVLQDTEKLGFGILPFFSAMRFNPEVDRIVMPEVDVVRRALADFMCMARLPVCKTAGNFPAALAVALQGDKNPANVLPPLATPWTELHLALSGPPPGQEGMRL